MRIVHTAWQVASRSINQARNISARFRWEALRLELGPRIDIRQSAEGRKMLAGELYSFADPVLCAARERAQLLYRAYNQTTDGEQWLRTKILKELLGSVGEGVSIRPPFYCDYGVNLHLGDGVDINFGCIILDCGEVTFGKGVLVAPGFILSSVGHPISPQQRATLVESTLPVKIGDGVWIGTGVRILPGVEIGPGSIIGANATVSRSIRANYLALGTPCIEKRPISDDERGSLRYLLDTRH